MPLYRLHLSRPLAIVALSATLHAEPPASAAASLAALRAGNAAFAANPAEPWAVDRYRGTEPAPETVPLAVVLSCAEPTAPVEVLFRARPGSLIVVRTAGPLTDQGSLAAIEYAVTHARTPLIVVMGHEACDIVRSSLADGAGDPEATHLEAIRKKLRATARKAGSTASTPLRLAVLEAVEEQINELLQASPKLRRVAETQMATLVGAYYEHSTGLVHFSQPVQIMAGQAAQPTH